MIRIALLAAEVSANTQSWLHGLRAAGADIQLITLHPLSAGLPGTHVVTTGRWPGKVGYAAACGKLRGLLKGLDPDLVIGYHVTSYGLMAALSWSGPLVVAAAGSDILRRRNIVRSQIVRFVLNRSDLVLAWAEHMSRAVMARGVQSDRIMLLPRGIDTAVFSSDGPAIRPDTPLSIVWTRSFKHVYDPETAIRGFQLFVSGGRPAHFTMFGDGALTARVDAQVDDLGITRHLTRKGAISDASVVAQYLRGADVYLSSSVSDGASASLFEAMACGAFPVVADIPANREWIVHGRNGLLFPPGDAHALANALRAAADLGPKRQVAAALNTQLVRERLDRYQNSVVMLAAFERIVRRCSAPVVTQLS